LGGLPDGEGAVRHNPAFYGAINNEVSLEADLALDLYVIAQNISPTGSGGHRRASRGSWGSFRLRMWRDRDPLGAFWCALTNDFLKHGSSIPQNLQGMSNFDEHVIVRKCEQVAREKRSDP
jgi:hypothetical protein